MSKLLLARAKRTQSSRWPASSLVGLDYMCLAQLTDSASDHTLNYTWALHRYRECETWWTLTVWHATERKRRVLHVAASTTCGWSGIHAHIAVNSAWTCSTVTHTTVCRVYSWTWHWAGITLHWLRTYHLDITPATLLTVIVVTVVFFMLWRVHSFQQCLLAWGGCLGQYHNMVEWFWWGWSLSQWPIGFLQCFGTVGSVIWPVKIVTELTYNVSNEEQLSGPRVERVKNRVSRSAAVSGCGNNGRSVVEHGVRHHGMGTEQSVS